MFFYSLIYLFPAILLLIFGILIAIGLFKNKKRTAESIYKLIDDLEKKYIYENN